MTKLGVGSEVRIEQFAVPEYRVEKLAAPRNILVIPGQVAGSGAGGDVDGPASAVNNNLAAYDGTTGKLLKDSGLATSAVATLTGTQTLTNKTLTAPVVNSPTGIVKGDVGLGNVDNTSDATKNAASVTLTNKTISGASNTLTNISADSTIDGTTNHVFTAADDTKLAGIATGATANDTDANLKNRANHTGTQMLATISDVTASAAEVNVLDGVTSSTAELNLLDGVTATTAELNHVDGVTSAIQTQLDGKASTGSVSTVATDLSNHISDATDAHDASAISYAGGTGMSATDVEAAIDELATEKADLASPALTGNPTAPTQTAGNNSTRLATTAYADGAAGTVNTALTNHVNDTTDAHDASAISVDDSAGTYVFGANAQAFAENTDLAVTDIYDNGLAGKMTRTEGGREGVQAASGTSGTVTLDCSGANIFTLTPTGNVTTLTISNAPSSGVGCTISLIVSQGATPRTIATPTGGVFIGAASPTQVANKICVFTYLTVDGGTTWICSAAVQV